MMMETIVKAFPLYMNALDYFRTHSKYEKNPKIKEAITQKFMEYLRRAEEIRVILDCGQYLIVRLPYKCVPL
jgi:vacuolar protein-sorting-associated protein 4